MKSAALLRSLMAALVLPLAVGGCADDGTVYDSVTALKPGGAAFGYVLNEAGTSTLLQFSLATGGTVTPSATLTMPANFAASAVAVDPTSGVIYVGGVDTVALASEILVYPAGSAGVATPTATITPANKSFSEPLAMTVDKSGKLYVASVIPGVSGGNDVPTIAIFASGATGAATPARTIAGGSTGLYIPTGIAVDASGNLYVSNLDTATTVNSGVITEFGSSATGNAAPLRAITNVNQVFNGVAVDAQQNVYATLETVTISNGQFAYSKPSVVEFATGASGPATPIRTISGTLTGLAAAGAVQVDSVGNLYVVNQTSGAGIGGSVGGLLAFSPAASGNEAPAIAISSGTITASGGQFAIK